ncbi:MAG: endonuclease/exonuclease/phosphatase family protein [Nitrososphaerota archaeon]|nr:endonuclease/exonuclease/phosphatase family protein [Nitrososphaerota archaeon]
MKQSESVDMFCFQEVLMEPRTATPDAVKVMEKHGGKAPVYDLYQRIQKALPDFSGVPSTEYIDNGGRLAIFFRKGISLAGYGESKVLDAITNENLLGTGATMSQSVRLQWAKLPNGLLVANTHGAFIWGIYGDCLERAAQSRRWLALLERLHGKKLLVGDLNLKPELEGTRILEAKMRNLVKENNVTTTRSLLSAKDPHGLINDYVFTSPDLYVKKFEVLPDVVSDHLPLLIEVDC